MLYNAFESFTLLDKCNSYRISDRVFGLVSSLFSIFCYLSYIDMFVHYLIRLYVIDMFVWMKMFQQWHIHCTRKVASDINIHGSYFLQYFWSNFLGPNLWYWSSFCSIFRHYHFSNNYRCLYKKRFLWPGRKKVVWSFSLMFNVTSITRK